MEKQSTSRRLRLTIKEAILDASLIIYIYLSIILFVGIAISYSRSVIPYNYQKICNLEECRIVVGEYSETYGYRLLEFTRNDTFGYPAPIKIKISGSRQETETILDNKNHKQTVRFRCYKFCPIRIQTEMVGSGGLQCTGKTKFVNDLEYPSDFCGERSISR